MYILYICLGAYLHIICVYLGAYVPRCICTNGLVVYYTREVFMNVVITRSVRYKNYAVIYHSNSVIKYS